MKTEAIKAKCMSLFLGSAVGVSARLTGYYLAHEVPVFEGYGWHMTLVFMVGACSSFIYDSLRMKIQSKGEKNGLV